MDNLRTATFVSFVVKDLSYLAGPAKTNDFTTILFG
jgi:hypothetical protein